MSVLDKYNKRAKKVDSLVCVGLDSDFEKIPEKFKDTEFPQFEFNKKIIDQTQKHVSAYKINTAFYEARGEVGVKELKLSIDYLKKNHPDIFTICDAKRADIGNTNKGYMEFIFDWLGFDAVTLNPYLGKEALEPFLNRKEKVNIILCRTSNPGAGEFQNLKIESQALWQMVAKRIKNEWNYNDNCMIVIGATRPEEIKTTRKILPNITFLVPGVGKQGGDAGEVVKNGLNSQGLGLIINSSRSIIFSDNPSKSTKKLKGEINKYR